MSDESITRHLEAPQVTNPTADVLRRAKALIDAPEKWIQGHFCIRDAYCIEGAIYRAVGVAQNVLEEWVDGGTFSTEAGQEEAFRDAHECVRFSIAGTTTSPFVWQDSPHRTHAQVIAVMDHAIALAERGE